MRYFKAYETNNRPFVLFNLVADSLEELEALGMDEDPLVVTEDQLVNPSDPGYISYEYGICHKRIFNGDLEDRPSGDITTQQAALNKATNVQKTQTVNSKLDEEVFSFDSHEFPLTPAARSVYMAVIELAPASRMLISTTGSYIFSSTYLAGFKAAYYAALFATNDSEIAV